jgi:hypothetical protein
MPRSTTALKSVVAAVLFWSVLLYFVLLLTTLFHLRPHDIRIPNLVKRKLYILKTFVEEKLWLNG